MAEPEKKNGQQSFAEISKLIKKWQKNVLSGFFIFW